MSNENFALLLAFGVLAVVAVLTPFLLLYKLANPPVEDKKHEYDRER